VPDKITIVLFPPRSPELNPVENVWQFMRDNWLSNRVFTSYDDIVDHCCEAWNKLVDRPWTIMSIGMCDWADHVHRHARLGPSVTIIGTWYKLFHLN
jgi:putative transposase